ncbi:MAG TPA: hypothetical protein DIW80_01000 [Gordonia polyisoprenivorans]|uniref:Uncharacterized protein n=2 Tax=Gordonia polyisoprenivorans TaxID=84595 RepID=A0A846WML4_9ACTN|nr:MULTISPECIES: hypothetical protein [Gordonia]MDF3282260.1 hypothetical protein [Gordonia sp. N1V]NKY02033.1 hypothetical protein [Gordonia polyisoprenivorans]OPX13973.1 hypothetical protein B1964_17520 [Gordonia sp. i37]OZC31597.1 hypothetical protein CJJ17_09005 [Gordonia polyisoprenivorans]QUD84026.1 hypothetical protein J8M97_05145 [Gordonia polyisoprenivorans]
MTMNQVSRVGECHMNELLQDIRDRADMTPSLPAVRFGGHMVTYGELDQALDSFEVVMAQHGMSREAAFYAAVLHSVPALAEISDPDEQGRNIDQVVAWLGRHLEPTVGHLRVAG